MDYSKFSYEFDYQTRILFKYYFGKITIDDIIESWDYAKENHLIPKSTNRFVLDYRRANFVIKIINREEQDDISYYYKRNIDIFGNSKIAIVTEDHNDIVVPFLVMEKDSGYISKPFTTMEAAIQWVIN